MTTLMEKLIVHYKMNDNTGTKNVVDSQGYLHGIATRNTNLMHIAGKFGGAFGLDEDDNISCGTLLYDLLNTYSKVTINLWYRATGDPENVVLWRFYGDSHNGIQGKYDEEIAFRIDGVAAEEIEEVAGTYEYDFVNRWNMFTWTFEKLSDTQFHVCMYINADLKYDSDETGNLGSLLSATTYIGPPTPNARRGDIDNFMFFNDVLTAAEISELYNGDDGLENILEELTDIPEVIPVPPTQNLLRKGAAYLASVLQQNAGETVVYKRAGVALATCIAIVGKTDYRVSDDTGFEVGASNKDFIIDKRYLVAGETQYEPAAGDIIETDFGTYEVAYFGQDGCWRWSDPYRQNYRIHTKETA